MPNPESIRDGMTKQPELLCPLRPQCETSQCSSLPLCLCSSNPAALQHTTLLCAPSCLCVFVVLIPYNRVRF